MNEKIQSVINAIDREISPQRQEILKRLSSYITDKSTAGKDINLNFICTHNSRRSHLSQIWAQVAAHVYGVKNVNCYSGGTESTAVYTKVIQTLEKQGFDIKTLSESDQPYYAVKYDGTRPPIMAFSKTYDNAFNPNAEFAAIMTCNHADQNCPFIPNCEMRIPVPFTDPKAFDNTPEVDEKYLEKSIEIASEMLYVFKNV